MNWTTELVPLLRRLGEESNLAAARRRNRTIAWCVIAFDSVDTWRELSLLPNSNGIAIVVLIVILLL